jgi:tetratricopeptide (TPR) repeat protein
MASESKKVGNAAEIDRLALVFAKDPGSKVFIPLAEEYGKAGMWEEAVAVLEDGLKTYPGFITAMVALGRAYEQMNQPVKAKAILEEAIKVSPDNLRAHRILAKLYTAQGAKESAIRSCNVILSLNPHDQEALSLCAGLDVSTAHGVEASSQEQLREKPVNTASLDASCPLGEEMISAIDDVMRATNNETRTLLRSVPRSEEMPIPTTGSRDQAIQKARSPVIARLEQWLNFIQDRRRDPQASSRLHS